MTKNGKKRNLFFITLTVIGLSLFFVLLYKIGWDKVKEVFVIFSWWQFSILVASYFLSLVFVSLSTIMILKALGYKYSFKDMYPLSFVRFAISYITPVPYAGGEPVQIYLMYKRHKIPVSASTSTMILERVARQIMILVAILAGAIAAIVTIDMSWSIKWLLIGTMVFFLFALWMYFSKSLSGEGFLKFVVKLFHLKKLKSVSSPRTQRVIKNIDNCTTNFLTQKNHIFLKTMGYAAIWTAIMIGQIVMVLYFMGYTPTITNVLILYMVTNLIVMIPTPGMLGTFEIGGIAVFALQGLGAGFGLVFSLILRIANIFAILPGLFLLPYFGLTLKEAIGDNKKVKKLPEEIIKLDQESIKKHPFNKIRNSLKEL